jgi:polysaccharide deacetylase 2 family uncharacterized protein YibQ
MPARTPDTPGPLRSGFVHAGLSFGVFSMIAVFGGAAIHIFGNAEAANPVRQIALFEPEAPVRPVLKNRFAADDRPYLPVQAAVQAEPADASAPIDSATPDLGVNYREASPRVVQVSAGDASPSPQTVRINGVAVTTGQSWQDTRTGRALPAAPIAPVTEQTASGPLPAIATDGRTPAGVYARPFANPESRPTVSIVLGGLGINYTHTKAAIEELPPEITLSFAPSTRNLQSWINQARAAGHEVLLEVPMEPYDFGRERPHPQTLYAGTGKDIISARLNALMGQASGYFGVTNYQGSKFATDSDAAQAVAAALAARGLALIEDGSFNRSGFSGVAVDKSLRFGLADMPIDIHPNGSEIQARLLELETLALEQGRSLGTGFAYPVTIDILKAWTKGLDRKGLALAPASAATRTSASASKPAKTAANDIKAGGQSSLEAVNTAG